MLRCRIKFRKYSGGLDLKMDQLTCFKAYDIRGKLGSSLNVDIAYRIGRAYGDVFTPKTIVIGGDIRLSSKELKKACAEGLMDAGVNVIDLGMTGTEEIYFATQFLKLCGGVEVTASHNPIEYNGLKLVKEDAKPINIDTGLREIKYAAEKQNFKIPAAKGALSKQSTLKPYINHLMTYIKAENFSPLKLVMNAGNGAAGHVIDAIEEQFNKLNIPIEFVKIHHEADGRFPNGIPNPLLKENRKATSLAVLKHKADIGIAWDGDFDRCFFFDEKGSFIESYYIIGLLAQSFLQKDPHNNIIHDPRLMWNITDIVEKKGGKSFQSKAGHSFFKETMRKENAIYGGEMSAHHYFRDFAYCDSGMIPWMLITELLCLKKTPLSAMVSERIAAFPSSGEINFSLKNPDGSIEKVIRYFKDTASNKDIMLNIDETDGVSLEFKDWRFNLRKSNTEPVIRLNVESRADQALMKEKTKLILDLLKA